MNLNDSESGNTRLRALLRESGPSPPLPPRFQADVWRRIERGEIRAVAAPREAWLNALAAWTLRPRLAVASIAAVLLAGLVLGALSGASLARQEAQSRYLTAVAPNPLR